MYDFHVTLDAMACSGTVRGLPVASRNWEGSSNPFNFFLATLTNLKESIPHAHISTDRFCTGDRGRPRSL